MLLFIRERSEGHRASRAQFLDSLSLVVMLDPAQNARKETFRPTNDNDGPALCSIFSEAEEKKERRGGEKKRKRKEEKKKI